MFGIYELVAGFPILDDGDVEFYNQHRISSSLKDGVNASVKIEKSVNSFAD